MSQLTEIYDQNAGAIQTYCNDWNISYEPLDDARWHEDDEAIAWAAHKIWVQLPDRESIRYGGFYPLCDLAEHVFSV